MGQDISNFPRPNAERPWNQEINIASFRGVIFEISSATVQFGRRGPIHEFPFKDIPQAEDVGRKARVISIAAFVDGDDYILRRNALIKVIEEVSTPGTLVLPTLGSIRVKPTDNCSVTYNNQLGGMEVFTLKFVEAGMQLFPAVTENTTREMKGHKCNK